MIAISISSELAGEHPRFMAECAERGHRIEVFDSGEAREPARNAQTEARNEVLVDRPARPMPANRR
jgi:hypothetical protein